MKYSLMLRLDIRESLLSMDQRLLLLIGHASIGFLLVLRLFAHSFVQGFAFILIRKIRRRIGCSGLENPELGLVLNHLLEEILISSKVFLELKHLLINLFLLNFVVLKKFLLMCRFQICLFSLLGTVWLILLQRMM